MTSTYDIERWGQMGWAFEPRRRVVPMKSPMPFRRMIKSERLISTWSRLAERKPAAGPDRVRFEDVSKREACDILRAIAKEIRHKGYQP